MDYMTNKIVTAKFTLLPRNSPQIVGSLLSDPTAELSHIGPRYILPLVEGIARQSFV